jgi:crotonobetainyl-CoA:carnitine CoA-transferase CaiB-like acyl-CoA transferase
MSSVHSNRPFAVTMLGRPPLSGLRLLDFTLHAAGPFCTQMLTMLGAQCIKIETAGRPDIFRKPHPVYGRMESASFDQVNAGKQSIRLNLKHARGVELAKALVAVSDIVAESFRPGVMERLGLGYGTLSAIRPGLVMVSVSAAGQTGPDSRHAGYAPLFGAAGGLGHLTGYPDGPPVEVRHVMDHSTGLNATAAVLAACYRRKRTGQGQHVDVAATDVAMSFIGGALLQAAFTSSMPYRRGNEMLGWAPHNVFACSGLEQWIAIAVETDAQWSALCERAGPTQSWTSDPRFASREQRWNVRSDLERAIAAWTATQSRDVLVNDLQQSGVPAFASCSSADVAASAHLRERGTIMALADHPGRAVVGPPWRFQETPARLDRGTPALGGHVPEVFGGVLGLSDDEIESLKRQEVIW